VLGLRLGLGLGLGLGPGSGSRLGAACGPRRAPGLDAAEVAARERLLGARASRQVARERLLVILDESLARLLQRAQGLARREAPRELRTRALDHGARVRHGTEARPG
jgi:hypothetical protein